MLETRQTCLTEAFLKPSEMSRAYSSLGAKFEEHCTSAQSQVGGEPGHRFVCCYCFCFCFCCLCCCCSPPPRRCLGRVASRRVASCRVVSCRVLLCRIVSCRGVAYPRGGVDTVVPCGRGGRRRRPPFASHKRSILDSMQHPRDSIPIPDVVLQCQAPRNMSARICMCVLI